MDGKKQRRLAYVPVLDERGRHRLGIAEEGEPGYYNVKDDSDVGGTFASREAAQAVADSCNERLGLTPQEAADIVLSSVGAQIRAERSGR